jgi:thymidine kinase
MCSGKSTELHRRLSKITFGGNSNKHKVACVNHINDQQRGNKFYTHNKNSIRSVDNIDYFSVSSLNDLKLEKYNVIGVDEGQFFKDLINNANKWANKHNVHVIVAGLSGDFRRNKFGFILDLIPHCERINMYSAFCGECDKKEPSIRQKAPFTFKLTKGDVVEDVGGIDKYIPVCRECYEKLRCSSEIPNLNL